MTEKKLRIKAGRLLRKSLPLTHPEAIRVIKLSRRSSIEASEYLMSLPGVELVARREVPSCYCGSLCWEELVLSRFGCRFKIGGGCCGHSVPAALEAIGIVLGI